LSKTVGKRTGRKHSCIAAHRKKEGRGSGGGQRINYEKRKGRKRKKKGR
jgi:hypothetical protein